MCRPWSKQLNWWDSISLFWFHADDWLQNDQALWSMLEIFTIIDSPIGIVVPGSYSGFLEGYRMYCVCLSVCVCNMCWFFSFRIFIYLFEQLFVIPPSALCIDVNLWGSQSWLLTSCSLLLYQNQKPSVIDTQSHGAERYNWFMEESVCVGGCVCWEHMRQLKAVKSIQDGQQGEKKQSLVEWKESRWHRSWINEWGAEEADRWSDGCRHECRLFVSRVTRRLWRS